MGVLAARVLSICAVWVEALWEIGKSEEIYGGISGVVRPGKAGLKGVKDAMTS